MKGFKKLILTSAILAASSSAFAMQALDEDTLSATTGQDGLTISIANSTVNNLDVTWVDRGGFTGYATDGAVDINSIGLSLSNLVITIDAGSNATTGAQLNIGFNTTSPVTVNLANTKISVADGSAISGASTNVQTDMGTSITPIIQFGSTASLTISNGLSGSIKLGNRAVGEHLMQISTQPITVNLTGGLDIIAGNAGTTAAPQYYGIGMSNIAVNGLQVQAAVDADMTGLTIDTTGTTIGLVGLERVKLGDLSATAPSIGDVYLSGLNVATKMTITGH